MNNLNNQSEVVFLDTHPIVMPNEKTNSIYKRARTIQATKKSYLSDVNKGEQTDYEEGYFKNVYTIE